MGRKKLTADALRARGCKPGRVRAREAEQLAEAAAKEAVTAYVSAFAQEESTFLSRCRPGESLCRDINGQEFNWPENHYLTICRDYAQKNVNGAAPKQSWVLKISKRFLSHFTSDKIVIDSTAAENVRLMCEAFLDQSPPMNYLRLLSLVEFWATKKKDGTYFLPDEELLNFFPADLKMQDQAILAIREHMYVN